MKSAAALAAALAVALGVVLMCAGPALAGPWWRLSARAAPTYLPPGGTGLIDVTAEDLGDTGVTGASSELTLEDVLPVGLAVSEASAVNPHRARAGNRGQEEKEKFWKCSVVGLREVSCSTPLAIPAYEPLELEIPVEVQEPPGTVTLLANQASISGGEGEGGGVLPGVSLTRPVKVSSEPVLFGIEEGGYTITPETETGALDTQAGSHPFQLTSTVEFNQTIEEVQEPGQKPLKEPAAPALTKDLSFNLPPGLLGNVKATEQCSGVDFSAVIVGNLCPAGSAIGVATVTILEPARVGYLTLAVPVFNLEPAQGEPARFGFVASGVPVALDTRVRSGGDYGVTVSVNNATGAAQVLGAQITFWGQPDNPSHDSSRGWACLRGGVVINPGETCETLQQRSSTPFLTLPTSCTGPLSTLMEGDSWTGEQLTGQYTQDSLGGPLESLEGCEALPFSPSLTVAPEQQSEAGGLQQPTSSASTPTGLSVDVKTAQRGTLTEGALADADVKDATVTLPEGMLLNPSAANGLQACTETQIGYLGAGVTDPLSPGAPEPLRFSTEKAQCPGAAKLGSVRIKTPLLDEELAGWVYLAAPAPNGEAGQNPFSSLIALYIVAENATLGIRVKLAGEGTLNSQTGQITTSFKGTPQVPFEELKLQLFGGPRGSVSTPPLCGAYTATTSFTAWSGASSAPVSEPSFAITTGVGGGPCPPDPLAFAPGFQAGSTDQQAGAFTPFTVQIDNPDGDQPLQSLTMHLPTGVAALLSTLTPCPEPPAGQEWACGSESLIGQSSAQSGLGGEPVTLPGQAYLTVGYDGAPFGLLVITPAVAGPFNLGDVDVRSRIEVNPNTAAVSIASDPFPTFVRGVPVQLKQIDVSVDRPDFEFNPTNCNPTSISGVLTGAQGASEQVSSPFQVSGCQSLPFAPKLTATAAGKGSKADGTSLKVTVTSGGVNATGVAQAGIAKVDLQLPLALSSRLPTLQKACPEQIFNTNPASCDEGSVIGNATIHTPVLKNPLTGPAYLVSHGGAEFPDVEFVLQGEGITLVLDGKTDIKDGITYSRFESTPDAPFTIFETDLPAGPHSVLTPNVPEKDDFSLCKASLSMPTEITGQNGAVINQTTKIAISGCNGVLPSKTIKPTKAQLLAKALKTCRKKYKHARAKRAACEKQARKKYAAKPYEKKTSSHRKRVLGGL